MEKNPPHATPKKDANPDPKISKDELPDSDLNKVTGGTVNEIPIVNYNDKATAKLL